MSEESSRFERRYRREKQARKEAESILEEKSRELFEVNQKLQAFANTLEQQVKERTMELETARDEALASAKAKSYFLANMSHEIRTPMNGLLGVMSLLKSTELSVRQRQLLDTGEKSGILLLQIINDILDFSKLEANKLTLENIAFDPRDLIEVCGDTFSAEFKANDLNLFVDIEPDMPRLLEGDPTRIQQVLINFLSNAVKFTEKGYVLIEASYTQKMLTVSVEDTGIGMTQAQTESIFDAFSQADESTTRKFGGTGLGLSICQRLIQMMKGTLSVKSTSGEGTRFTISLPLNVLEKSDSESGLTRIFFGEHILAVIEHPISRQILEKELNSWGVDSLRTAESIQQASESKLGVTICIVDMALEGAKKFLRENLGHFRFILLGHSHEIKPPNGSMTWISKPIKQSELYDALLYRPEGNVITPATESEGLQPGAQSDLSGVNILLAEDNHINQIIATDLLEGFGASVEIANNGQEASQMVQYKDYHAVLMDIQMPVMDGAYRCAQNPRDGRTVYRPSYHCHDCTCVDWRQRKKPGRRDE